MNQKKLLLSARPSDIFYPNPKKEKHHKLIDDIIEDEIPEDQKLFIESKFPEDQRATIISERAMIRLNKGDPVQGIVSISNHFVYLFFVEDKITFQAYFHMFEMNNYRVKPHKLFIFARPSKMKDIYPIINLHIISKEPQIDHLAHVLRRNYLLSTYVFSERCDFRVGSKERFLKKSEDSFVKQYPALYINLSISQQYQFTYSAFCSYMNIPYYHEIVLYYHDRIRSFDGIFDYTLLPDDFNEDKKYQNILLSSVFALQYVTTARAVICHHRKLPYIAKCLGVLLKQSGNISSFRFIHLVDCGISQGINDIGSALIQHQQPIEYFNFSINNLRRIDTFFEALGQLINFKKIFFISILEEQDFLIFLNYLLLLKIIHIFINSNIFILMVVFLLKDLSHHLLNFLKSYIVDKNTLFPRLVLVAILTILLLFSQN